jgi:acetyltransferase-like isoleucine patch superfamily enzyme
VLARLRFLAAAARYTGAERKAADSAVWLRRNYPDADETAVRMGRGSYGNPVALRYVGDRNVGVTIGQFCSISDQVIFLPGGGHHPEWVSTFPFRIQYDLEGAFEDGQPASKGPITVGNDVWIGRGARILSGVTIGDGAVVGAFSVVAKSVRPYGVVAGAPAIERKRRFTDDQIDALLRIAWWDWPLDHILAAVPKLCAADIDAFIQEHDQPPRR